MLCRLLASTGVAGDPHEWFWRDSELDFRRRWRAIQSGHWHHWDPSTSGVELEFRFEEIDALADEIRTHDAEWRTWFTANGIEPFQVTYEELAADPERVTGDLLGHLGLVLPAGRSISTDTEIARDDVNEEWAARYRRLRADRSSRSQ